MGGSRREEIGLGTNCILVLESEAIRGNSFVGEVHGYQKQGAARWSQIIGLPGASPRMLETFQRRLLRISGRLVRSARRLTLRLPARWPWQRAFIEALERIRGLPALG